MPRKASHGWSFRSQNSARRSNSVKYSSISSNKKHTEEKNQNKKIFLQPDQIEFLVNNYEHLENLVTGKVPPGNEAGQRLIDVVEGKLLAKSKYEKAYMYLKKYNISLKQLKKKFYEISDSDQNETKNNTQTSNIAKASSIPLSKQAMRGKSVSINSPSDQSGKTTAKKIDHRQIPGAGLATGTKSYARKVSEPLGTREDFKRDRASWKRGGR